MEVNGIANNYVIPTNKNITQLPKTISIDTTLPIETAQEQREMPNLKKEALSLAVLGALSYGLVRYGKAKDANQILEAVTKKTKDGGAIFSQTAKKRITNPDGTHRDELQQMIKTLVDKNGVKRSCIIHDYVKGERYTSYFDKDGNITKNIVSKMSMPCEGEKARVLQEMTYTFSKKGKDVITTSRILNFTGTPRKVL